MQQNTNAGSTLVQKLFRSGTALSTLIDNRMEEVGK